jgi:hypothetical protein
MYAVWIKILKVLSLYSLFVLFPPELCAHLPEHFPAAQIKMEAVKSCLTSEDRDLNKCHKLPLYEFVLWMKLSYLNLKAQIIRQ